VNKYIKDKREDFLLKLLPYINEEGWQEGVLDSANLSEIDLYSLFPGGIKELRLYFSDYINQELKKRLQSIDPENIRIRDRVKTGVLLRFEILTPWRGALQHALTYDLTHVTKSYAVKSVWRAADIIWLWAGDMATDYNKYTKRSLLCGIISTATLFWLKKGNNSRDNLEEFLDRRIENVMQLNKIKRKLKIA
jgi:ubiquinone biosynthesis protein COQ9